MAQSTRSMAVSSAKHLKRNGGHVEVEITANQRVHLSGYLAALGEFEGCKYVTRKLEEGRFAIMRIES